MNQPATPKKCGTIALLGRPNMGKSTLLNGILGQKIAGVSAKPQTTRNRILGNHIQGQTQMLFLDTPGMHRQKKQLKLNSLMNREAWGVLDQADIVCYLVDCVRGWEDGDAKFFQSIIQQGEVDVVVLLTKVDKLKKFEVKDRAAQVAEGIAKVLSHCEEKDRKKLLTASPIWVSAKDRQYIDEFLLWLDERMPEGDWQIPEDDLTDKSQKFIISELIREQVFRCLGEELPYSSAVRIDQISFEAKIVRIIATIIVARASHKGMVIGKRAAKIKEIGTSARQNIEKNLDQKVFLDLQVQVDENWFDDRMALAEYSELGND